jgi:predicted PurR-regulated permease PerM
MPIELIILLASLVITWLVFTWLIKVLKASIGTAIAIAAIVLILQIIFGINNQDIWQQIINLPQTLLDLFSGK